MKRRGFSVYCFNWGKRGAGTTTAFISFSLQIHFYFCTSHAAHTGKGGSSQASVAHCLCQQSSRYCFVVAQPLQPEHLPQQAGIPTLLLCRTDLDLHTYCLSTTHSARAWAQWAQSPYSHTMSLSSTATEEQSVCPAPFSNPDLIPWKTPQFLFAKAINQVYAVGAVLEL